MLRHAFRLTLLHFSFFTLHSSLLPAFGQDKAKFVMEPGPKSPEESLKCIKTRPGFKVELMACEPAVMDPIALAFGPEGKLWVVEMGDYPLGVDGKNKFGGKVKFLEKTKPDGLYDKATVFLDNLGYPTGVFPWKKGVLITCAPDILYAEDTDSDGKADKIDRLFTGFREGNQQHRVNGLVWGLDNWIYGANGDSGGSIRSDWTGAPGPVNINGRDFRIWPGTRSIEPVTGQSQFGRCRDDWGNWFGCNNSNPMFHFILEDRYLKRNPTLLFTDVKAQVSEKPGAAPVFPISKPLPRFNTPTAVNHFTSACSVMIYRDELFGPEFEGNSFVAEPVHNLIHREIMRPEGLTFRSKRADDEQTSEFLASSDNWFRPAMIATGPDGALWIADMYRYVIEHPEWIPKEWQAKLDLRAGHNLGRIYRVYPEGKKPRAIPNLAKLDADGLVAALDSPSGWQRDMAQQLLVTAKGDADTVAPLEELFKTAKRPQTRLHALMAIQGLQRQVSIDVLTKALRDDHPAVRKHAILCFEDRFTKPLGAHLFLSSSGSDPHVLLQLAYTLGEFQNTEAAKLLAALADRARKDRHLSAAVVSSINKTTYEPFMEIARNPKTELNDDVVRALLRLGHSLGKPLEPELLVRSIKEVLTSENLVTLASLCDSLAARSSSLGEMLASTKLDRADTMRKLDRVFGHARAVVENAKAPLAERMLAVRVLGRGVSKKADDIRLLEALLNPATSDELQQAALGHLARVGDDKTPAALIERWKSFTPGLRGAAFDALASRKDWVYLVLINLETKKILPAELDAARRARLLGHPHEDVRQRAAKLLETSTSADRAKVLRDYTASLALKGNAGKGAAVFKRACAVCHKLGDLGQNVGPDLASVGDRTASGLLNAILDPNRAVEPRYLNYLASTKAGLTVVGILASETSTSLTLVTVDGKKHDVLRADLDELISTGKSAMPEGLEKDITVAEMADLLAYLTTYLPPKVERP